MRVLLAREVDRAAIDAFALAEGWELLDVMARRGGRPAQLVFASAAGTELVTFVEDHRIDARYLRILGHDPAPVAERVRAALPSMDEAAVVAMLDEPGQRIRALCWLGVVAPEREAAPIMAILRQALASDDEREREAARFAAEATGWPSLREALVGPAPDGPPHASAPLPERPRLISSVHARLHLADGTEKVILNEWRTGALLEIDLPSFRALEEADGTRDLDALCLALARKGLYRGQADLVQLLSELNAAGVLADGLEPPPVAAPVPAPPEAPPDRPLEVLEGFTLVCDGSGGCCRFYGSIAFTPAEALRARVIAEDMDLPLPSDALFLPVRGAQPSDDVVAVAQVDGRCVFLAGDGRCGLHARGGASAKPFACGLYPAMFMDDGSAVRVSLGPECACVFASIGRRDGAPLVPEGARTLADLSPDVRVMQVPDPVPLSAARTASRPELSRWSAALTRALATLDVDALALAWTLAGVVEEDGLSLGALERATAAARAPSPAALAPWIEALKEHAAHAAAAHESWRGASDLARQVARWIAGAVGAADLAVLLERAPDPASERFYLRALAHGHRLALEGRTLAHGLRDRAARITAARAMSAAPAPSDASARYPLALVEAAMRNLGMSGYADALGPAGTGP